MRLRYNTIYSALPSLDWTRAQSLWTLLQTQLRISHLISDSPFAGPVWCISPAPGAKSTHVVRHKGACIAYMRALKRLITRARARHANEGAIRLNKSQRVCALGDDGLDGREWCPSALFARYCVWRIPQGPHARTRALSRVWPYIRLSTLLYLYIVREIDKQPSQFMHDPHPMYIGG